MSAGTGGGLLRCHRDFRLLWLGETTGTFGAAVSSVALPLIAVTTLDASTFEVGLLSAASWLPWLVVGLPVHMLSGEEGEKAREARAFGEWASDVTELPVAFHDERLTTASAELLLMEAGFSKQQRKARLDKLAAQIMLQSYLDRRAKPRS